MAKISAHGAIIGTVEFITSAKRYMSDRTVLKNSGDGWKRHSKVMLGISPAEAFERTKALLERRLADNTALALYREKLHELAPLSKRRRLHDAVTMMPNDPDGVWSEACDGFCDNVHADVDEIARLCAAYELAQRNSIP